MSFYSEVLFPRCLDWAMSDPMLSKYRQEILSEASGNVLEIGFGTGVNLQYYPTSIEKLTVIDPNPGLHSLAKKRIDSSPIQVESQVLNSESLPMDDHSFDSVVSTWTLCSITNVAQALTEVYRVLKPGGKFIFVEHGLSNEPKVQVWQNRLTPVQKILFDGCHLNRNIKQMIENNFQFIKLEQFYEPKLPKFLGYLYKGVAIKN